LDHLFNRKGLVIRGKQSRSCPRAPLTIDRAIRHQTDTAPQDEPNDASREYKQRTQRKRKTIDSKEPSNAQGSKTRCATTQEKPEAAAAAQQRPAPSQQSTAPAQRPIGKQQRNQPRLSLGQSQNEGRTRTSEKNTNHTNELFVRAKQKPKKSGDFQEAECRQTSNVQMVPKPPRFRCTNRRQRSENTSTTS